MFTLEIARAIERERKTENNMKRHSNDFDIWRIK